MAKLRFPKEGKVKPRRGGQKAKYERGRVQKRKDEEFEPLSWIDPETGERVRLSQMGRKVTRGRK